jgi:hypothetical protein
MPCLHAPAKNRLTILARAKGRDTTIALPRSDRVVGTCSSPATSVSLPHMRDVPCAESRAAAIGLNERRDLPRPPVLAEATCPGWDPAAARDSLTNRGGPAHADYERRLCAADRVSA